MKSAVIVFVFIALAVLHQDIWNWDNSNLVFGFLPVGLAYHAGLFNCSGNILGAGGEVCLANAARRVGRRRR